MHSAIPEITLNFFKYLFVISLGLFIFTLAFLIKNTRFPRYNINITPSQYGMPYQRITFNATDGIKLSGWLVMANRENPVIIVCHGLGTSKSDVLDIANVIYKAGYNLFLFDFRGHGESGGGVTSYGYLEQRDITGALNYLDKRNDIPHIGYGVFGPSMGGATACLVAGQDMRIKALVLDSVYIDLKETIIWHTKLLYNLPKIPFGLFTIAAYDILFLTNINTISPIRVIKKISPRAVFIINGEKDERMPAKDSLKLYEAAGEPKKLWIAPSATHFQGYWINQGQYEQKITDFFYAYLPVAKR